VAGTLTWTRVIAVKRLLLLLFDIKQELVYNATA